MTKTNIAFIGAGNMAASLIGGLIAQGWPAQNIHASEPSAERRQWLTDKFAIHTHADNQSAASQAEIIVLAVKPQLMQQVCQQLTSAIKQQQLIISIAAGISSASLKDWLEHDAIVRCMPNTPALVQQGMSALFACPAVSKEQQQQAEHIMQAVGQCLWLTEEQQLDAVTAVSGSGPAYFFLLVEAMTAAGEKLGLPRQIASQLANQTALGAASMLCTSELDAAELRQQVTSPQGTTDAAIRSFQADDFEAMVERALQAAATRSQQLAQQFAN